MKPVKEGQRESGVIDSVQYGLDDRGIGVLTCFVFIKFAGSCQGFGGLVLEEHTGPDYLKSICDTFDVSESRFLKGKKCFALRCWGFNNDRIEGLEAESGKRFITTQWVRKHYPDKAQNSLDARLEMLRSDLASHQRRIVELKSEIAHISEGYVDWEKM